MLFVTFAGMQRFILIIGFVFCSALSSAAQVFYTAQEYNDAIIANQEKIVSLYRIIGENMVQDPPVADSARQAAIIVVNGIVDFTKRMPDFNGNGEFRDASVHIFQYYLETFRNEYKEILEIFRAGRPDETQIARLEFIDRQLQIKEQPLDDAFVRAQMKFAFENDLELMRSPK